MSAADLIRKHEGLRLTAYPDPGTGAEPWTIGYGHTLGVVEGMTCTKEQAEAWLQQDMAEAYAAVDKHVRVPLKESQRDALCSFVFNVGAGAFASSSLLRLLNDGDISGAADQFKRWNKANGKVLAGLSARREEERNLFLKETTMAPLAVAVLTQAIPALLSKLPELATVMTNKDRPLDERRVEAIAKAGTILVEATQSANVQEAVEKVQADPLLAQRANEALRAQRAELQDLVQKAWEMDEKSVADARAFYRTDEPVFMQWHFVHILSLLLVLIGGGVALWVIGASSDATERAMALQTVLLVGFASVVYFWLGSSRSSQLKDLRGQMIDRQ